MPATAGSDGGGVVPLTQLKPDHMPHPEGLATPRGGWPHKKIGMPLVRLTFFFKSPSTCCGGEGCQGPGKTESPGLYLRGGLVLETDGNGMAL